MNVALLWLVGVLAAPALAAPEGAAPEAVEVGAAAPEVDEAYVAELVQWLIAPPEPLDEAVARERALTFAQYEASLPFQTGEVEVAGLATLALGPGDRFLGTEAAASVLEAWGNPPGQQHDGMIFPAGARLFGPESWGVIVDYRDIGWVDDGDAATIDYDELLTTMKAENAEANEYRRELGLEGLTLLRWAEPPSYDAERKVLYWARALRADSGSHTLNYEVRVLGRGGVLSLNAVADLDQLGAIREAMEPVRRAATFHAGQTYADYEPGVDPTAGIGIAALVAGGALAATKGGLFKGLLAMLLAGKKFVLIAGVAVLAFFGRMFSGLFGGRSRADEA